MGVKAERRLSHVVFVAARVVDVVVVVVAVEAIVVVFHMRDAKQSR